MLVNIIRAFDSSWGRRYVPGENPDVDPQVAIDWIQRGVAAYDQDGIADGSDLTGEEMTALRSAMTGQFSGATYDGSGRLTGFSRAGIAHTVSYPNSTTAVISNASGITRTVTIDGSGRVTAIV